MDRRYRVVAVIAGVMLLGAVSRYAWPDPPLDLAGELGRVVAGQGFVPLEPPTSDLRPGDIHPAAAAALTRRGCWRTAELQAASLADFQHTLDVDRRARVNQGLRLLEDVGVRLGLDLSRARRLRFRMTDWRVAEANGLSFVWDAGDCWSLARDRDLVSVVGRTLRIGAILVDVLDENGQTITSAVVADLPAAPEADLDLGRSSADHRVLTGDSLVVGVDAHDFRIQRFRCAGTAPADGAFALLDGCPGWNGAPARWYRVAVAPAGQGNRVRLRFQEVGGVQAAAREVDAELGLEVPIASHALRHDRAVVSRSPTGAYDVEIDRYELQPAAWVGYQEFAAGAGEDTSGVVESGGRHILAVRIDSSFGTVMAAPPPREARPMPDRFALEPFRIHGGAEAVADSSDVSFFCDPARALGRSPGLCGTLVDMKVAPPDRQGLISRILGRPSGDGASRARRP